MKFSIALFALALLGSVRAELPKSSAVPLPFSGLLEKDVVVRAEIGGIVTPPEMGIYNAKVEKAALADPVWFKEASVNAQPGTPLPFSDKMGLTKEEYASYIALWNKREFKAVEKTELLLRENSRGWTLVATGAANSVSTLTYDAKADCFRSPNGELKRSKDIDTDAGSILGSWQGHEWRYTSEGRPEQMLENVAFGKMAGGKYGIVVYRIVENSSTNRRILDRSMVIRFPLQKGAASREKAKSTAAPVTKETPAKKPQH